MRYRGRKFLIFYNDWKILFLKEESWTFKSFWGGGVYRSIFLFLLDKFCTSLAMYLKQKNQVALFS